MSDQPDRQFALIEKNSREVIRVALRTFKGHRNADLRVYALNHDAEHVATAKGISIRPAHLEPVIEALQKLLDAAREEGLL